jgi:hypothetical protein
MRDGYENVFAGNYLVAAVGEHNCGKGFAQAFANARLIAAAPDLLAACEMAKKRFDDLGMDWLGQEPDPLEAAIAKARGTTYGIHGGTIAPDSTVAELDRELGQQTVVGGGA